MTPPRFANLFRDLRLAGWSDATIARGYGTNAERVRTLILLAD